VNPVRHIELDIDIGADAKDWSAIQAGEKLKPAETELRRIEEVVAEIVSEMDYLRGREQKLRDTNESTNERVKWFAFGTMGMLVALGAWQVVYLRAYFRYVHPRSRVSDELCMLTGWTGQSILSKLRFCILILAYHSQSATTVWSGVYSAQTGRRCHWVGWSILEAVEGMGKE
jgi:emp24/gp25L/p24 family/GOLD